jgi:hypothetical protein
MPFEPHEVPPEVRVTVDGAEFCAFLRAVKQSVDVARMDETVLSVRGRQLLIETAYGGRVLACTPAEPATVRVPTAKFFKMIHLSPDAKITGPLDIILRPEPGEIILALAHPGTKIKAKLEPRKPHK